MKVRTGSPSAPPPAPPRIAVAGASSLGAHAFALGLLIGPYLQFHVQHTDDPIGIATELLDGTEKAQPTTPNEAPPPPEPLRTTEPAPPPTAEQAKPQSTPAPPPTKAKVAAKGQSPEAPPDPAHHAPPDEEAQLPPKGGIETGKRSGKAPTPVAKPVPPPPERFRPSGLPGRHAVIRVQRGASGVAAIEETVGKGLDTADQYKLFLDGSGFVASRDFRRLALIFVGRLDADPTFLAAELADDSTLWTTGINRPRVFENQRTYSAKAADKARSIETAPWLFGHRSNTCLLKPKRSRHILLGSKAAMARAIDVLGKGQLAGFLSRILTLDGVERGIPVLQLSAYGMSLDPSVRCGARSERLTASTTSDGSIMIDGRWGGPTKGLTDFSDCVRAALLSEPLLRVAFGNALTMGQFTEPEMGIAVLDTSLEGPEEGALGALFAQRLALPKRADAAPPPLNDCENVLEPLPLAPPGPQPTGSQERGLRIHRVNATEVHVSASQFARVDSLSTLIPAQRIIVEQPDSQVLGVRIFGVRPDTDAGQLGFQNGDRVESINGKPAVGDPQISGPRVEIKLNRRGQPAAFTIVVVSDEQLAAEQKKAAAKAATP